MRRIHSYAALVLAAATVLCACQSPTLWELKCAACHDGKTVLNEAVVPSAGELRARYGSTEEFVAACDKAPRCMNILKHDRELFRQIAGEIGIGD